MAVCIEIVPLLDEHLREMLAIERESFPTPWSRAAYIEAMSWHGHVGFGLLIDAGLAGYICLRRVLDEAEVLKLAVKPSLRRRGIGRMLMEHAAGRMREAGVLGIHLEVRASNTAALAFYKALGFRRTGARPRYYADNSEDALVMSLDLGET